MRRSSLALLRSIRSVLRFSTSSPYGNTDDGHGVMMVTVVMVMMCCVRVERSVGHKTMSHDDVKV